MINIVLCSSHPMLIAGFRTVILASEGFSLSVCRNPVLLTERLSHQSVDIVLADLACGITLDLLTELRATAPAAAVILWTDNVASEFIFQAISLGVLGVLRKDAEVELCLKCLRRVAAGELWLDNELSNKLLRIRNVKLTLRERQLTGALAQGLKNKEIAFRLGITEGTVKVYLSRLYKKVGAGDRLELALFTLKHLAFDQPTASAYLASSADSPGTTAFMPLFVSVGRTPTRIQ